MDRRFLVFLLLMVFLWQLNLLVWRWIQPPPPAPAEGDPQAAVEPKEPGEKPPVADPPVKPAPPMPPEVAAPEAIPEVAQQYVTLGSLDSADGYTMLVTLDNRGAGIRRVELNGSRFHDLEDSSGYLGQLELKNVLNAGGVRVGVVGPGTPAAAAGLKAGDVITALGESAVTDLETFEQARSATRPGDTLRVKVQGRSAPLELTLIRRPLEVIRPEDEAAVSLRTTLASLNDEGRAPGAEDLPGAPLKNGVWEVEPDWLPAEAAPATGQSVRLAMRLPARNLAFVKRFRLPPAAEQDAEGRELDYHLDLRLEAQYTGQDRLAVTYELDGFNGLPKEGSWYAVKNSPYWSGVGLRDVVWKFEGEKHHLVSCALIAKGEGDQPVGGEKRLLYAGVDSQYFAGVLIPQAAADERWFARTETLLASPAPAQAAEQNLANTSFRLTSTVIRLDAQTPRVAHEFRAFIGPKQRQIVAEYGLRDLIYYGWFWFAAEPLVALLHAFYSLIPNYGVAIVLLTVVVRLCMFPLSKKQALNSQKMQEVQPEMKRIAERYKNKPEERIRATQELYRKYNFNPAAGCLPMFIQLPIFVGLYRSLSCTVELREAPLLGSAIRWCSNLAAPDMLFDWSSAMPNFVVGMMGPYFNVFPLITIVLFLWQQKLFLPPAADEQTRSQQKMMQYMMVFVGLMFFKVASGLCLYFVVSSLWGIAERKVLPQSQTAAAPAPPAKTEKKRL